MYRTSTHSVRTSKGCRRNVEGFFGQARHLWNDAKRADSEHYAATGKFLSYAELCAELTRKRKENHGYARCSVALQRSALRRYIKARIDCFRRRKASKKARFPRYKGSRGLRSVEMSKPSIKKRASGSAFHLKGCGYLKFKNLPEGEIKLARVIKTARGLQLQIVVELPDPPAMEISEPIGIDLGVKQRAMLSNGECLPPVKLDRRALKRKQRKLSRAKKGSKSRAKRRVALAREWERVKTRERNALHRITTGLVRKHNRIAMEDLQIQAMARKSRRGLNRSRGEQNWSTLIWQLTYKAESAGGEVIKVNPVHTSMDCSRCQHRRSMPLPVREYRCSRCGLRLDRDLNASRNILQRGIALAGWDCEASPRPGASQGVRQHVIATARHDAEQYEPKVPKPSARTARHSRI